VRCLIISFLSELWNWKFGYVGNDIDYVPTRRFWCLFFRLFEIEYMMVDC